MMSRLPRNLKHSRFPGDEGGTKVRAKGRGVENLWTTIQMSTSDVLDPNGLSFHILKLDAPRNAHATFPGPGLSFSLLYSPHQCLAFITCLVPSSL